MSQRLRWWLIAGAVSIAAAAVGVVVDSESSIAGALRVVAVLDAASESLVINMGINSGRALLGAAKFDSLTGSRWTYTARGMVTNVAARIGAVASKGAIHLSRSTADRVNDHFSVKSKGKFRLKNVSEDVEIFAVNE